MPNISCLKCQESFNGRDEIRATKCGHLFHKGCLNLHYNRCPECGKQLNNSDIHEVHFDFDDQSEDELEELREELADMRLEMRERDRRDRRMQRELEELRRDANRGRNLIVEQGGTVVICDRYEPTSVNLNLGLDMNPMNPFLALAPALLPMLRR